MGNYYSVARCMHDGRLQGKACDKCALFCGYDPFPSKYIRIDSISVSVYRNTIRACLSIRQRAFRYIPDGVCAMIMDKVLDYYLELIRSEMNRSVVWLCPSTRPVYHVVQYKYLPMFNVFGFNKRSVLFDCMYTALRTINDGEWWFITFNKIESMPASYAGDDDNYLLDTPGIARVMIR